MKQFNLTIFLLSLGLTAGIFLNQFIPATNADSTMANNIWGWFGVGGDQTSGGEYHLFAGVGQAGGIQTGIATGTLTTGRQYTLVSGFWAYDMPPQNTVYLPIVLK